MEHMNNVHGLPTWNVDADTISENGLIPVGKAFGNSMREYEVKVGLREIDLIHAMHVESEEIKNIVRISVQKSPQKIQFGAVIQLRKPIEDSEDCLRNHTRQQFMYSQKWNELTSEASQTKVFTKWLNRCSCHLTALHLMVAVGLWIRK